MTQLVCLAKSVKHNERCIAGIETSTGRWIRPVTDSVDGSIPKYRCLIDGHEPQLLDVIDIPLAGEGPDFGFQSENRRINHGAWSVLGRYPLANLQRYLLPKQPVLYNTSKYVLLPDIQAIATSDRRTLQLVRTQDFEVFRGNQRNSGRASWRGNLRTSDGYTLHDISVTDSDMSNRLDRGYIPAKQCLLTISLGLPWRPWGWVGDEPCWKLIAGVIEIDGQCD